MQRLSFYAHCLKKDNLLLLYNRLPVHIITVLVLYNQPVHAGYKARHRNAFRFILPGQAFCAHRLPCRVDEFYKGVGV